MHCMAMVVGGCAQVNDTELMPALSTAFSDEAASSDGFETIFDQQRKERAAEARDRIGRRGRRRGRQSRCG